MSESASTPLPPPTTTDVSPKRAESSNDLTPAPLEETSSTSNSKQQSTDEPVIDPELMDLPAPPHHTDQPATADSNDANSNGNEIQKDYMPEPGAMGITESIASAPNPRPADFPPPDQLQNEGIDLDALSNQIIDDDMPGSPTAKMMRAIAPPTAIMTNPNWAPPPPNASVNLFIGRALLSNGNDNWPLKPNDIVNWIRKHYPSEWDGDEGRCSAHRVRTYLARKGADMYYEKLNQGCINGWRIRANHLWRFDNGGFQGRGMKQEEAQANTQREQEALANAARKEAAAAALAAGHPGVKVSMSNPGINDGLPIPKKPRTTKAPTQRRKSTKKDSLSTLTPNNNNGYSNGQGDLSLLTSNTDDQSYYQPQQQHQDDQPTTLYGHLDPSQPIPGPSTQPHQQSDIDPALGDDTTVNLNSDGTPVDINMVQQAMQAAAGQMDDLEMGIQLPIEMQMHSNEHEDADERFNFGVDVNVGVGTHHQNGQTYGTEGGYNYNG
ncbi:uncharacterized protein IL334_000614 [Kwoniella shivajii]|uniref:Fork-head domain-containing protein n=1 Tax=Kwoniella shivajii TaxID=564305 RepID=A0ABZ1CPW3_9TREE|nr:hypothetical protein IL334_000614 [Kwoniella shivajii]